MRKFSGFWLACVWLWLAVDAKVGLSADQTELSSNVTTTTLAELGKSLTGQGRVIASFRVEGVVCAVNRARNLVALQDDSATVLLALPRLDASVHSGVILAVEGHDCALTRDPFELQVGTAPVVDLDGTHPKTRRSGSIFLGAGMQPIRVEWFNWIKNAALTVQYEGPGVPLQAVPSSVLCRKARSDDGQELFVPGIEFSTYLGHEWTALPDFQRLRPFATGLATNFDISLRPRQEHVGMVFAGYLKVTQPGIYNFLVDSDDGGRLWVGDTAESCMVSVLGGGPRAMVAKHLVQPLIGGNDHQWSVVEGDVRFASPQGDRLVLDVLSGNFLLPVTVVGAGNLNATNFLKQRVRATGIYEFAQALDPQRTAQLIVPGPDQLENLASPGDAGGGNLNTAEQVRDLQPDEAKKSLHAKVRGVVTMATHESFVLQDSTGGVFIWYSPAHWIDQPRAGEAWEVEGATDPGDFSPVILAQEATCLGNSPMPEPVRPTWDQLMNGGVDAEWIEIQGVITRWVPSEMDVLTRDGKIKVLAKDHYFLPALPPDFASPQALIGSLVRVRGVFAANWDSSTRHVKSGEFYLGNAALCVDETAPKDPFSIPTRHATDPLLFTSHLGALTRFKVCGQVLYASPGQYLLLDGSNGVRVLTAKPVELKENDLAEAVGFPQLGGASAVLLEATARKIGTATRPKPTPVSVEKLSDRSLDATLVEIQAVLLSDVVRQQGRVLELRAGPHHFLAELRSDAPSAPLMRRGSRLQLTGVYSCTQPDRAGYGLDAFELLLNRPHDILVLQQGPWWTIRHTIVTITILLLGLVAALIWITQLRRTVAQRTTELKQEIEERQAVENRRVLEQERARVAQDLHDDLGAGLAQIGWVGALAQRTSTSPERAKEYLAQITSKASDMVAALDEIVWAINPKHDSATALSGYLCDYAEEFLQPAGIACRFDVARDCPAIALNSQQRHQLFLAFKEALTNVVKHAHASQVWIRIGARNGDLNVAVEDNGRGLSPNGHESKGDGLTNMRDRLDQIAGRCEIESRSGGGTIVRFRVRLEQTIDR